VLPPICTKDFVVPLPVMSARDHVEDTYETQNDQRLDELHSKIRTLRGVRPHHISFRPYRKVAKGILTDHHRHSWRCRASELDVGRYRAFYLRSGEGGSFVHLNPLGTFQGDHFSSFTASLTQTSRKVGQAFGIGQGGLKTWRIAFAVVGFFFGFWIVSKIVSFWWSRGA
jgi:blocked-early-in-transport protein 1